MKVNEKLATAVTLCVLGMSSFQFGGTVSAAELVVEGGFANMTAEQKAEWVNDNAPWVHNQQSASNNIITLSGDKENIGDFTELDVYGGLIDSGESTKNVVTIIDAEISGNLYGGYAGLGNAANNEIILQNVKVKEGTSPSIIGGEVYNDGYSAFGNGAYITGFEGSAKEIKGGKAGGSALNNKVILSGVKGQIDTIIGGEADVDSAEHNVVELNGNTYINSNAIIGGYSNEGSSKNNMVNISGGSLELEVIIGGQSKASENYTQTAEKNQVNLQGVSYIDVNDIIGGSIAVGNVNDNIVNILEKNTITADRIIGGCTEKGNAEHNKVNISGANTINANTIAGGYVDGEGNAENNLVSITGEISLNSSDSGAMSIYGGYSKNGNANKNVVAIEGAANVNGVNIYGGYSEGGAVGNYISIENSTIQGRSKIHGGRSDNGAVAENIVNISNSIIAESSRLYGGSSNKGNANDNKVVISDSKISFEKKQSTSVNSPDIAGGVAEDDTANGNYIVISNSNVLDSRVPKNEDLRVDIIPSKPEGIVVSGWGSDSATGNGLVVSKSIIVSGVVGGYVTSSGCADGNEVLVSDSEVYGQILGGVGEHANDNIINVNNSKTMGNITGGLSSTGTVNSNTVLISGASEISNANIHGGYSLKGSANKNTVVFENSRNETIANIYGGMAEGYGNTNDNMVIIKDSSISGSVIGGYNHINEYGYAVSVNNNHVLIHNSTIMGDIAGAWGSQCEANNNTVVISGTSDVSKANIYGVAGDRRDDSQGNTLVLDGWSGKALEVAGFDKYSFQNIKKLNENGAVLTVDILKHINNDTQFDLNFAGSFDLQEGSTVKLIESQKSYIGFNDKKVESSVGTALDVDGIISNSGNDVDFTVDKISVNRQTDVIGSANAAAAAFVSNGSELAVDGLAHINSDEYGYNTFATTHGANSDYDNNIDLQGWNNIVGVGHNAKTNAGDFAWGVFYEGGTGEYDTTNSYHDNNFGVDGKAVYNGGGVAARLSKDDGVYYEAGLRAGKLKNDVSNALVDANNVSYGYKTESDYFGYHVGVGKTVALENGNEFDVYARYHHTQVDGDSFVVGSGDRYNLDKVYSDRIRIGGRYQDNTNEAVKVYYGAAYEYEFSGESEGSTHGYAMETADLGGSTFIGEIGLLMNNPGSPWTVDMALQGYTGERNGFGGRVQANYSF